MPRIFNCRVCGEPVQWDKDFELHLLRDADTGEEHEHWRLRDLANEAKKEAKKKENIEKRKAAKKKAAEDAIKKSGDNAFDPLKW